MFPYICCPGPHCYNSKMFNELLYLQSRGNDILGIGNGLKADDNLPYSTISYANGPGHALNVNKHGRKDLLNMNMRDTVSVLCMCV